MIKYLFLFFCTNSFALEKWIVNNKNSSVNFSIPVLLSENVTGTFKKFNGFIEVDRKNFEGVANITMKLIALQLITI